jgi:hypothetical protein
LTVRKSMAGDPRPGGKFSNSYKPPPPSTVAILPLYEQFEAATIARAFARFANVSNPTAQLH